METIPTRQTFLNIAQVWPATRALGPGLRAVLWVQGCPRQCPDCISPEWIPQIEAQRISVKDLAVVLLSDPSVEGFTFSGGEPMLQANGLAALVRTARQIRELNVICFTGYSYKQLFCLPTSSPVHRLLAEVDVLIDGPYIKAKDDNRGLRGSSNQKIIHLTDRLRRYDFANQPRRVELHVQEGYTMMVGIPPHDFLETLEQLSPPGGHSKK